MKNVGGVFVVLFFGCGVAMILGFFRWYVNIKQMAKTLEVRIIFQLKYTCMYFSNKILLFFNVDTYRRSISRRVPVFPAVWHKHKDAADKKKLNAAWVNQRLEVECVSISIEWPQR